MLWQQDLSPISDMSPLNIDWKEEEKTLKKVNVEKLNKWKGKKWLPWWFFWLTVDWLHDLKQWKLTVQVFTREIFTDFLNLCIFLLFNISIINCLISDDGDFVCCRVIAEMQHAMETRLPFYKWRYKYLLNLRDRMAMMKAMPLKVKCSNKISPLLHLYFYNINTFNTSFKLQFNFACNFNEL